MLGIYIVHYFYIRELFIKFETTFVLAIWYSWSEPVTYVECGVVDVYVKVSDEAWKAWGLTKLSTSLLMESHTQVSWPNLNEHLNIAIEHHNIECNAYVAISHHAMCCWIAAKLMGEGVT